MPTRARLREWAQAFGQLICLILRDLVVAHRASGGRLPVLAATARATVMASTCVVFTSIGLYEGATLFGPLTYLELPSAANDAAGWIFLFHRPFPGSRFVGLAR